jgi:S1-C subfamily serine protease
VADTLNGLPPSKAGKPSQKVFTELGERLIETVQKMTTELGELSAPSGSKAGAEAITRELEAGLKQAESDPSALIQADPFSKAGNAARDYGVEACTF